MLDTDTILFCPLVHDFIGSPKFEGEFFRSAPAACFLTIMGEFNGIPVDEIEGRGLPILLFYDVVMELLRLLALVEKVGI